MRIIELLVSLVKLIWELLWLLMDLLVPRFVTEWVIVQDTPDGYYPICAVSDLDEHEWHEDLLFCQMHSFAFLGMGLLPKQISQVINRAEYDRVTNTNNHGGFA